MSGIQNILVYIIVAVAIGYLVKKYFLPKTLFSSKKTNGTSCGDNDCGCH